MVFRIFIALVALAVLYLSFETVRLSWLKSSVLSTDTLYAIGPDDADLTVVKFLDYTCEYCKKAHPILMRAIEDDGRVRFIPRPVGNQNSGPYDLERLPYAAAEQEQFFEMHEALLNTYRVIDEQHLRDITLVLGLDFDQLLRDYESEDVIDAAQQNDRLFRKLRLSWTPSYMVGGYILFTPAGDDPTTQDFLNIFEEARTTH